MTMYTLDCKNAVDQPNEPSQFGRIYLHFHRLENLYTTECVLISSLASAVCNAHA